MLTLRVVKLTKVACKFVGYESVNAYIFLLYYLHVHTTCVLQQCYGQILLRATVSFMDPMDGIWP